MPQLVAAGAVWGAFALVYIAGLYHIRKIWLRGTNGPPISRWLLVTSSWRYYGWVLVGAATVSVDPITGLLLISTRIPAALIMGVLMIQKKDQRPKISTVIRQLSPELLTVLLVANVLIRLPAIDWIRWCLLALVAGCFILLIYPGIPRQISAVRSNGSFGILVRLQEAQLLSYIASLAYGFFIQLPELGVLMLVIYGTVSFQQAKLVYSLESTTRRWKQGNSCQENGKR